MKVKLIDKKQVAQGTMSFYFECPVGFNYLPGQFVYLTLPTLTNDYRGPTRQFTLASSPTEEHLQITTRIRDESNFKQMLKNMETGTLVEMEGASGTFILDEKEPGSHVFLAGGIGVTPFRSFIKYNFDKSLTDTKLHLIYSNKILEMIAFREEFETWDKKDNIKVDMCITQPEESKEKWTGLMGRIDEVLLKKLIIDHNSPFTNYWLCGPSGMVTAMEAMLQKMKIKSSNIYSEKFTGY